MNKLLTTDYPLQTNTGLSLVELMVSISIFIMMTSLVMANYPKFSNKLSIDLLAEDIALSIRQAQIYGSTVFGTKNKDNNQSRFFGAYGIHFADPAPADLPGKYIYNYLLFADVGNPNPQLFLQYDGDAPSDPSLVCDGASGVQQNNECVQKFIVTGGNRIKYLCSNFEELGADTAARVLSCKNNIISRLTTLDVIFVRPNLNAEFTVDYGNGLESGSKISNVGIVLESLGGDYDKTVVVWKTGQISVE